MLMFLLFAACWRTYQRKCLLVRPCGVQMTLVWSVLVVGTFRTV